MLWPFVGRPFVARPLAPQFQLLLGVVGRRVDRATPLPCSRSFLLPCLLALGDLALGARRTPL
jgi:hypothetical protein